MNVPLEKALVPKDVKTVMVDTNAPVILDIICQVMANLVLVSVLFTEYSIYLHIFLRKTMFIKNNDKFSKAKHTNQFLEGTF